MSERRIVCAAIKWGDFVVCGARHYDQWMHKVIRQVGVHRILFEAEMQGFIDNRGNFLDREEAYKVAVAADQIRHKTGNPNSKQLFSEDLY